MVTAVNERWAELIAYMLEEWTVDGCPGRFDFLPDLPSKELRIRVERGGIDRSLTRALTASELASGDLQEIAHQFYAAWIEERGAA